MGCFCCLDGLMNLILFSLSFDFFPGLIGKGWFIHHLFNHLMSQIFYQFWICAGELFFITDRKSGFWNLHKWVSSLLIILTLQFLASNISPIFIVPTLYMMHLHLKNNNAKISIACLVLTRPTVFNKLTASQIFVFCLL